MYTTRLIPAYKDYIWGGKKLAEKYGKDSKMEITAESWELACHKDGKCLIADGEFAGKTLEECIDKESLGKKAEKFEFFPILIKFIDACDRLSVQVHPSDDYALENEGQYGKTEMWYVIEADEGASLVCGLNRDVSREEFCELAKSDALMDVLNFVPVKKGDVFFIKPGLIHAIGKGILICEIQQNSNLTYRVYDYNRRGADGKTRPLHLEKAALVADLSKYESNTNDFPVFKADCWTKKTLSSCEYFTVDEYNVETSCRILTDDSFVSVSVVSGNGKIGGLDVTAGTTVFVPATEKSVLAEGKMTFLTARV